MVFFALVKARTESNRALKINKDSWVLTNGTLTLKKLYPGNMGGL